jgi:hypothetical protein
MELSTGFGVSSKEQVAKTRNEQQPAGIPKSMSRFVPPAVLMGAFVFFYWPIIISAGVI